MNKSDAWNDQQTGGGQHCPPESKPTFLRQIATDLEKKMKCFCDLDNWQPNTSTGHSDVCPIHRQAKYKQERFNKFGEQP